MPALVNVEPWVVTSLTEYTKDPDLIECGRRDLGEQIEKMWQAARR